MGFFLVEIDLTLKAAMETRLLHHESRPDSVAAADHKEEDDRMTVGGS